MQKASWAKERARIRWIGWFVLISSRYLIITVIPSVILILEFVDFLANKIVIRHDLSRFNDWSRLTTAFSMYLSLNAYQYYIALETAICSILSYHMSSGVTGHDFEEWWNGRITLVIIWRKYLNSRAPLTAYLTEYRRFALTIIPKHFSLKPSAFIFLLAFRTFIVLSSHLFRRYHRVLFIPINQESISRFHQGMRYFFKTFLWIKQTSVPKRRRWLKISGNRNWPIAPRSASDF